LGKLQPNPYCVVIPKDLPLKTCLRIMLHFMWEYTFPEIVDIEKEGSRI